MIKKFFRFLFFIGLIAAAIVGFLYYQNFVKPNVALDSEEVILFIEPGADAETVSASLSKLNALEDAASFKWLAEIKNYRGRNIVAGKNIDGLTNNELINHLRAGNGKQAVKITINLERDLNQISGTLAKNLMIDSTAIYSWLTNSEKTSSIDFNQKNVIAMFIPNTYYLDWDISVDDLMVRMKKEYDKFWNESRTAKLERTGLNKAEVSTLASIVYFGFPVYDQS